MAKIKLTRNELKSQRESLKRFTRFLPTLELKKLQLELERRNILKKIREVREQIEANRKNIDAWQKLFSEKSPKSMDQMVEVVDVVVGEANIAGLFVPVFQEAKFEVFTYDFLHTPVWIDQGIEVIKDLKSLMEEIKILEKQEEIVSHELRKTTQRINLFREKLIPQCKENIRQIRIFLGDMQAAAVGRAKMAKKKLS